MACPSTLKTSANKVSSLDGSFGKPNIITPNPLNPFFSSYLLSLPFLVIIGAPAAAASAGPHEHGVSVGAGEGINGVGAAPSTTCLIPLPSPAVVSA